MANNRGRKVAGVSIANPGRIRKKVARAREYSSLHCSDDLKDEAMKTPRSFAGPPFPQTSHRRTSEERLAAVQWEGGSTCPD